MIAAERELAPPSPQNMDKMVDGATAPGYTSGMKTAVSIPDDIFRSAERLAHQRKKSRSRIYCEALREYLVRHSPDEITEAANRACDEIREQRDPFSALAARRVLARTEW